MAGYEATSLLPWDQVVHFNACNDSVGWLEDKFGRAMAGSVEALN